MVAKRILCAGLVLALLSPSTSFPHGAPLNVARLEALTSQGQTGTALTAGDEFWGVGVVSNTSGSPINVSWTMTLDGVQISYGDWTVPAGRSVLFTSIDSDIASPGSHTLELTVSEGVQVVAQATVTLLVTGSTTVHRSTFGRVKARYR